MFIVARLFPVDVIVLLMSHNVDTKAKSYENLFIVKKLQESKKL